MPLPTRTYPKGKDGKAKCLVTPAIWVVKTQAWRRGDWGQAAARARGREELFSLFLCLSNLARGKAVADTQQTAAGSAHITGGEDPAVFRREAWAPLLSAVMGQAGAPNSTGVGERVPTPAMPRQGKYQWACDGHLTSRTIQNRNGRQSVATRKRNEGRRQMVTGRKTQAQSIQSLTQVGQDKLMSRSKMFCCNGKIILGKQTHKQKQEKEPAICK